MSVTNKMTGYDPRGIDILLPNDLRQHHALHILNDVLPYTLCQSLCSDKLSTHRQVMIQPRKADARPVKENSNSHAARPVHLIITMIKWIRTSRLSLRNSLSGDEATVRL